MLKSSRFPGIGLILLFICLLSADVWAGPHLKVHFTQDLYDSYWGKVLIVLMTALALPFVFYGHTRQYFKSFGAKNALRRLAAVDTSFDWTTLKPRITTVFTLMHQGLSWDNRVETAALCTSTYWQDHQRANLKRWKDEGLEHKSQLKSIDRMDPLLVRHTGEPQGEGSVLAVYFKATVEDYLEKQSTGAIATGEKGFQVEESMWTFQLVKGHWLLNNIEPKEFRTVYLQLTNEVRIPKA